MSEPTDVIASIADAVGAARRPVLLGVDGPDGAGKTHFARALVAELAARGRQAEHSSVDHFHHPREHRHALGRTAESIWSRHFDYRAMRRELLDPWLAGQGASYRSLWHDVDTDAYVETEPAVVPEQGVLVVDGVFLQRPELVDRWDLIVYLDVPPEVTVARMSVRDGTPAEPEHPDQQRYLRAQELYRNTCDPLALADIVVDNADWQRPVVRSGGSCGRAWRLEGTEMVREVRLPADATARADAIDRIAGP